MKMQWNFQNTTPAGERDPFFAAGLNRAVIVKVEDDKPKTQGAPPEAFYVYFKNHPVEGRPDSKGAGTRIRYSYGEKALPFVMHLLMAARNLTAEQLKAAGQIEFDPTSPDAGLVNNAVWIDARPQSRADATDPNKKYDEAVLLTAAEYQKHVEEAAKNKAAAGAAAAAGQGLFQQQAPAAQQQAVGALPGTQTVQNGLPGTVGLGGQQAAGGLPGMPSLG